MSAKEMFETLGYEQEKDKYTILYKKYFEKVNQNGYIIFDFKSKTVSLTMDDGIASRLDIDMKLLKVINMQVEELGWNDENN